MQYTFTLHNFAYRNIVHHYAFQKHDLYLNLPLIKN